MNGIRYSHHLYGFISVLAALIFYGNFREETLLFHYLTLFHFQFIQGLEIPRFVLNHLPSFLQCLFLGYCARFIFHHTTNKPLLVGAMSFSAASAIEALQLTTLLPGTFDLLDIAAIACASFINAITAKYLINTGSSQSTFKPLLMSAAFSGAIVISMGCELIDSCDQDLYTCVDPVTLTWEELRVDIQPKYGDEVTLTTPGKIHSLGDLLFIVDRYRGIHIFNNSDSLNPMREVFIPIIGALDLSVQGDYIYVNGFIDLVIVNYQAVLDGSFNQSHVTRKEDIFDAPTYSQFLPENYAINRGYGDYIIKRYDNVTYINHNQKGFIIGYYELDGTKVLYGEYDKTPAVQEIGGSL